MTKKAVYDGPVMNLSRLAPIALASLLSLAACGGTGPYVWVDSLPSSASGGGDVLITDGDVLNVRFNI